MVISVQSQGEIDGELHDEASPEQADGPPLPRRYNQDFKIFHVEFQGKYQDEVDFKILASCRSLSELQNSDIAEKLESGEIQTPVNAMVQWINSRNSREGVSMKIENSKDLETFSSFYGQEKFWPEAQDSSDDSELDDESERLKVNKQGADSTKTPY